MPDLTPKIAVIRPGVQRHAESGTYRAVLHVEPFDSREDAEFAAKVLLAAAIEKYQTAGVTLGPALN